MPPTKTTNATRKTTRTKDTTTTTSKSTSRPTTKKPGPLPPTEDERTSCMRTVNVALQTLSTVAQSERKHVPGDTRMARGDAEKVHDAARSAKKALERLRTLVPDDLDVERAACSIAGKLIACALFDDTLRFLEEIYPRLTEAADASPSLLRLLSLPRPTTDDPAVLTLYVTTVTHALTALTSLLLRRSPPFSVRALVAAVRGSHGLLAWASSMQRDQIPDKTRDALLTKAYTCLNKTCAALVSNVDLESVFDLRMCGLTCLLYATPGTVPSTTFWDQVHKACLAYGRTLELGKENEGSAHISSSVSETVKLAQSLHEHTFWEGRSFVQMCETWMSFAKKGDLSLLDDISTLMVSPCSVDSLADRIGALELAESTTTTISPMTKDAVLVECAQCCATFVKATASFETKGSELERHATEATKAVHRYGTLLSNLDTLLTTADPDLLRARGKLERALERVRRAALILAPHAAATALLETIMDALEGRLAQETDLKGTLTSLVDILFALARTRLVPADVDSYTPALAYLERAVAAVDGAKTISTDAAATLLRCISGTLHNLGGTLYAAHRLGGAVRFLEPGCTLGRRALAMPARNDEGRRQLQEQLFRRYELLGVCHAKIGDRQRAYACTLESVATFPYVHHAAAMASPEPFGPGASAALVQLAALIERLTYTATCELLLPPADVSLRGVAGANAGALLMRQLAVLEGIGHKEGARAAMACVLADLMEVYDAATAPVQRARVVVAALGMAWRDETVEMDVAGMGEDALVLLSRAEGGEAAYTRLVPQLRVSTHLWLALHAYRRTEGEREMMQAVATHVEAAYDVLADSETRPKQRAARSKKGAQTRIPQPRVAVGVDLGSILGLIHMTVHLLGLLGLDVLKVRFLELLERACAPHLDAYAVICVDLAREYTTLGTAKRASALLLTCAQVLETGAVSDEVRLGYLLGRAEVLALGGHVGASTSAYREAQTIEVRMGDADKSMPTARRIRVRVERLERAALACRACAAVKYARDDVVDALRRMLQSLRLLNRAVDALARLAPPGAAAPADEANPFQVADATPKTTSAPVPARTDALAWRLLTHLVTTLLWLAHAYHTRGSPREAVYFVEQVRALAEGARAPAVVARARLVHGEVLLRQGARDEGRVALEAAEKLLEGVLGAGIDAADAARLWGDYGGGDPGTWYARACALLDALASRVAVDGGRRRSVGDQGGQGMVVPRLLSTVLGRQLWLSRHEGGEALAALAARMTALPPSAEIKGEEHAIMGKLTLDGVYAQFQTDMLLSSLTESAIALPMGVGPLRVPGVQAMLGALQEAESLFWADVALTASRGGVAHVREATVSLAVIRVLASSLGSVGEDAPMLTMRLLDASSAITLQRELQEAIPYKMGVEVEDMVWPGMDSNTDADMDENGRGGDWRAIEAKYGSTELSPTALRARGVTLPEHWTVIHLVLTPDGSSLMMSRLQGTTAPVVFCVPLGGRRDGEEAGMTLEEVLEEMGTIVRMSDEGTRRAVHVARDDREGRAGWWAERGALDKRLEGLLAKIEYCWLGAFKTILSPACRVPSEVISDLRTRLERVMKDHVREKKIKVRLDEGLLTCFSQLSGTCRDEELEDVAYFVLDVYQLQGVAIAIAEVDMDQVTVDLRAAFEAHAVVRREAGVMVMEDSHTFLVLDRRLQGIPWESVPVLRGQSVSRIPSVSFLEDRMGGETRVDGRETYYVLNPSGDLAGTEARFADWLRGRKGWEGIVRRAPSEQEMLDALSRKALVIYFGHGGGEQYVRSHKIRHLRRCAATMLWGCSSGALREMGEFDRVGTPYHYMVAGCPTLVANLWDVTDRDIDRFAQAVFSRVDQGWPVTRAVADARSVCKLGFLTGSAPVVYGIPLYL